MFGNYRFNKNSLTKLFYGCLSAVMLLQASCAPTGSSSDTVPSETAPVSEEVSATPDATLNPDATPDPEATPVTVDLSQFPEIPLPQLEPLEKGEEIAILHTSLGLIKLRFFPEYTPNAVQNFKTLAKSGYYDGVIFNRVLENTIIQSGDPDGTGLGGQSIWGQPFSPETTPCLHNIRGALSMLHGPDSNSQGSQFFIVSNKQLDEDTKTELEALKDQQDQVAAETADGSPIPMAQLFPLRIIDKYLEDGGIPALDFQYSVFGQVFEGLDVVDKINSAETSQEEDTMDKPLTDIIIESISFEKF